MITVPFVGGRLEGGEMAAGNWVQALEVTPAQSRGATARIKCFFNMQELS